MKKQIIAIAAVIVIGGSLLGFTARARVNDQPPLPLSQMVLDANAFPNAEVLKVLGEGVLVWEDSSHPLSKGNAEFMKVLEGIPLYSEGYGRAIIVSDGSTSTFVGHYLYRFDDAKLAKEAMERLTQAIQNGGEWIGNGWESRGLDSEGGALYVRLSVREEVLSMLIVNGPSPDGTERIFEQAKRAL